MAAAGDDAEAPVADGVRRCFYEILGVEMTASIDEIRKAYRKMALKWHPGMSEQRRSREGTNPS